MSFVIDYVQYTPLYDTFVSVSGQVSSPSNWQVTIPSTVTNSGTVYTVKTLNDAVFANLTNLKSIILPDTIINFGQYPFYNCPSLISIVLGANTVSISRQFAEVCSSLQTINLPDSLTSIGISAFNGCGLTSIVLPNNPNLQILSTAFAGNKITSLTFPNYNQMISGSQIFVSCHLLTSINFGNAIQYLPDFIFQDCISLKNITFPASLTNIAYAAFYQVYDLKYIAFEGNIPNIANYNFESNGDTIYYKSNTYNDSIISTIVPSKFTYAVTYTDINSIFPVNAPQNVTGIAGTNIVRINWSPVTNSETIDRYYISYYNVTTPSSITTVNVPGNVTKSTIIGLTNSQTYEFSVKALIKFSYSVASSTVQLTPAVSSNVPDAPQNVSGIAGINKVNIIWSAVTTSETIYKYQISYYNITTPSSITTIDIPENITQSVITGLTNDVTYEFSVKAFDIFSTSAASTVQVTAGFDTSSITFEYIHYYVNNSGFPQLVTQYVVDPPANWNLTIPSSITRSGTVYSVVSVGNSAFRGLSNLIRVIIPNSVTRIEQIAFYDCNSLTNITLSNSLSNIEQSAFTNCTSLKNIIIPNSVTSIGSYAFYNCRTLKNVILSNNLPYLPIEMFNSCVSLTNITIPSSVTRIEGSVFVNCFDLKNIVIPSLVTSIGSYAFQNCTSFENFVIPDSVTSIGTNLLNGCTGLINVILSNNLLYLSNYTFASCTSLINIVIPNSVTQLGGGAFYNCTSLINIVIPNSVTQLGGGAFQYCTSLINIVIPDSVKSSGNSSFQGCTSLINIVIPDSVTRIESNAFYDCINLTNIKLSNSLSNIEGGAFIRVALKSITFPTSLTDIGNAAFYQVYDLKHIAFEGNIPNIGSSNFESSGDDTVYYKSNTYNDTRISTIVPSKFTYAVTYTDINNIFPVNAPQNVTGIAGTNIVRINWSPVTNSETIDRYYISYYNVTTPSSITTVNVPGNVTKSTIIGLTNSQTYEFSVKALVKVSYSVASSIVQLTPSISSNTPIDAPQNVSGIAGINKVNITWSAVTTSETIYKYQISYYNITTPSSITTIDIPENITQRVITGLTNDVTYEFSVKAFDIFSPSAASTVQVTAGFDTSNITFEYVRYGVNNSGFPQVVAQTFLDPPANWDLTIPSSITRSGTVYSVVSVGNSAFRSCYNLINCVIPDSVTMIESNAFYECVYLIYIKLSNSLLNIDPYAFRYVALKSITFPASLTNIVYAAFYDVSSLKYIAFEGNIPNIGDYNFGSSGDDTIYYKSNTYNDSIISSIVPSKFTYAVTYTDINNIYPVNAPQNVTGIAGTNIVRINWSPVTNSETIDRYYISYYNVTTPSSITTVNVLGNVTKSIISGLTNSQTYRFSVKAFVKVSYSVASSTVQLTPETSSNVLDAPQNVTGIAGINKVNITWSAVTNSETIYKYQISYYNITTPSSITTIDIPENITQSVITGLTNDVTYEFSLKAFDIFSTSAASTVQVTPKTFDTSNITFEYVRYGVNNSGFPQLVTQYVVDPPANWNLTIPSSITRSGTVYTVVSVGNSAFRGLSNLISVIIPNSVTRIEPIAFYDCNSLTNITLSNSLSNIEQYAFTNCTSLKNIIIPNLVTSIGLEAFYNCTTLTSVILPNNLPYLARDTFANCVSLTNIVIPSSVTLIEGTVFVNCLDLTNITIPSLVTSIGSYAFQNCTSLTNFVIPDSVTIIGNAIFNGCNSLTNITISTGITSLPGNFFNTPFIRSFVVPENIKIISDSCFAGGYIENLYIPDSVTSFGGNLFTWSSVQLTSIRLPSNLTKIPARLFQYSGGFSDNLANNIESIIPASVTEIDDYAFYAMNIRRIDIPYGVTRIGQNVFDHSGLLTYITFPNTLKIIGDNCFSYAGFRNVTIPSSVTSIGAGAFVINYGLTQITINAQITEISTSLFVECTGLTKVNIPNTVKVIRQNAFYANYQLKTIIIPGSVTSIENNVFLYSGITKAVFLGTTIPTIGSNNFQVTPDTAFVQPNISQTELDKLTPFFSNITTISLDPPQNVTGTGDNSIATISWTAVTAPIEITKYRISYYNITTPSSITTVDVSGNITQRTITGLTNKVTYGFSVKAFIDDAELSSDASSTVQVTPKEVSIDAPQNVTGTTGISNATISWSTVTVPSPYTITKYQISYYDISNSSIVTTVDVSSNVTQTTISELTANVTYDFSVKAFSNSFFSEASSTVQVTPFSLNAPQNVSGTTGVSSATISWSAVTVPVEITKYQISYYDISNSSSITTVDVSGNVTQLTLTSLINDVTYGFSVKAFINDDSSVASSSVQVTPFSLNAPQNVTGTAILTTATISWSAVTAPLTITNYQVSYYDITTPSNINTVDVSGNVTQSIISGLTSNVTYDFSVKAFINDASSVASSTVEMIIYSFAIDAPQNVTGAVNVNSATISWSVVTAPLTITKYQIRYYDISNSSIINTLDVSGNVTQSRVYGLTNDVTYEFSVKAFINKSSSVESSKVQVTPIAINTPQNFTVVASVNRAIINWSAVTIPSPNTITKYQISYYDISNSSITTTVDVSGNITQNTIAGLTSNVTYEFSVKVIVNNLLSSDDSSKVQVIPFALNAPQNITGIANVNSATISWSAVILPSPNIITNYQISYYNITTQSNITTLDVSGNITQIILSGLTNNVTHEFYVKAFMNDFSSLNSQINQVTPFSVGIPQNVIGIPGVIDVNSATISWSTVILPFPNIITKYQISYYDTITPEVINNVDTNKTSLTINGIPVNKSYVFSVKTFFNSNSSESSDTVNVELSLINILSQGLNTVNDEPPPPTFFYSLATSSPFTTEQLKEVGITIVPVTVSKEEKQQEIQNILTNLSDLNVIYIDYYIS